MGGPNRRRGGGQYRGSRPGGGRGRGAPATFDRSLSRGGTATVSRLTTAVNMPSILTVAELAETLQVSAIDVIRELISQGIMATINQQVTRDAAIKVATAFGVEVEDDIEAEDAGSTANRMDSSDPGARPRPPVVTIMGHVDHGKTKLLDAIRETKVAEGEAGGITQHIGAYQVEVNGRKITFLDTPGHEAFTAMRARGARVTDVAVLVVAADDGVMPQTREAIQHAKAAGVPIVVAMNKIDLPSANPDRVKQQLTDAGVVPEDYGGETPVVQVSAREHLGIGELLDMILLMADIGELHANPALPATGVVIEAEKDSSRGVSATILVQNGTLKPRDIITVGATWGRVRAMNDDHGRKLRKVEPSTPAEILGLFDLPQAGDIFEVVADERTARMRAEEHAMQRAADKQSNRVVKLDTFYNQVQSGGTKELPIIVKADVQGTLGAINGSLAKLTDESTAVTVTVVYSGTGGITESDVNLASASGAVVIGFNVRPDAAARRAAEASSIDIRFYDVIYTLLDDVRSAMSGLLDPVKREVSDGLAEVRDTFKLPNRGMVAGLYVLDGKAARNSRARVLRGGTVLADTTVGSLKRFKDDVREVQAGYECGTILDNFADLEVGDQIEFYHVEEVVASL